MTVIDDATVLTPTELAKVKGVSQPNISQRLKRFEKAGLVRPIREGRKVLIRLSEWDRAANEITDPARILARETAQATEAEEPAPSPAEAADPSYSDHMRRKARVEADLKEDDLRQRRGELVEVTDLRDATIRLGETMVREIGTLSTRSDEVASAVARNGAAGAREIMRQVERDLRAALTKALAGLAAPDVDDEETAEAA